MPKTFGATLYCYVEPANAEHAKLKGKELFGSVSAFVNALIAKDRGVKPVLGFWQSKGEAKKKRERADKEKARKRAQYLRRKAAKQK